MALKGKFEADFASFQTAVDQSIVKLVSMEVGGAKAAAAVNRVANSLEGGKLISQAAIMVEAVDRIGGVSKLTDRELAKVAAQATEAAAKLRAMGVDVPPGMQRIADETKQVHVAQGDLLGSVKQLALGFGALFTARAALNFVGDLISDAGALKDLSTQTRISVEDIQLLAGGMSEFGVEADELAKGIFKLSRGIAGGDESVSRGLHMMGLSLKDVEGLDGKALFLKIEAGLSTLQGGLRDSAAAELYGSKLGAAMAGASDGIEGALETWGRLNTVTSTESVDAMDAYDEAITRAKKSLSAIASNMVGPVAQGFNVVTEAATSGAGKWSIAWAAYRDFADSLMIGRPAGQALATVLDELNQKAVAGAKATKDQTAARVEETAAVTAQTQAEKFMAALERDAAIALTSAQIKNLEHLKEIGALTAANATAIGVNGAQFAAYTAEIERAKKASTDLAAAEKARTTLEAATLLTITKLWEDENFIRRSRGTTANELAILEIEKWKAVTIAAAQKAGQDTTAFYEQLEATARAKLGAVGDLFEQAFVTRSIPAMNEARDAALKLYQDMAASGRFHRDVLEEQRDKYYELRDAARGYGDAVVNANTRAGKAEQERRAQQEQQEAAKKKADDAELVRLNRLQGGSFEIDRSNFSEAARKQGASEGAIERLLHQGYSFAQALLWSRHPGWAPPESPGPRVPGFAHGVENFSGGPAWVGEAGPEYVDLPRGASVTPLASRQAAERKARADRAEWDRLNELQAALWLAAGRMVNAEQQAIIDRMRPLTPAGFGENYDMVTERMPEGQLERLGRPRASGETLTPTGRGHSVTTVTIGAGAFVLHAPILTDVASIQKTVDLLSDEFVRRLKLGGFRYH